MKKAAHLPPSLQLLVTSLLVVRLPPLPEHFLLQPPLVLQQARQPWPFLFSGLVALWAEKREIKSKWDKLGKRTARPGPVDNQTPFGPYGGEQPNTTFEASNNQPQSLMSTKPVVKKTTKVKPVRQVEAKLKTVVRRLPPNLPEPVFWQSVAPWVTPETTSWKVFYPGKLGKG